MNRTENVKQRPKVLHALIANSLFHGLLLACALTVPVWEAACQETPRLPWPARHGPIGNGHVAAEDARDLPSSWDETSGQNIAWKRSLSGFGHSTPIIGDKSLWITSATKDGNRQFIDKVDLQTGDVQHQLLFENASPEPLGNDINTYASPTCALELDALYVHFGTYGTARLDPETLAVVWQRRDIECRHFRGPGSSPVIVDDMLILTFDGIDQQFLMGLNKHTGETSWRTERSTDYGDLDENGQPFREGDLRKAYSTPGVIEVAGRKQVVSVGSKAAFGYDAATGEEIWTVRHDDYNAAAPPVFVDGLAVLNTGGRGANLMAVRLDETTRGDVTESHVVWDIDKGNSRLAAPICVEGRIFMVTDRGVVRCVDALTGDLVWADRIDGNFVASPIAANGVLYFCNEEGQTYAIEAGPTFNVLARNQLNEGMRASPAAGRGALYLRTFEHLYKIESDVSNQ